LATSADVLLDTSVAVPFLLRGHPAHAGIRAAVAGKRIGLAGHAEFETFSVITRLPEPLRMSPPEARRMLHQNFPRTRHLSSERAAEFLAVCADSGVAGGAVYDALVAATAIEHGRLLATRDRRALITYAALGVEVLVLD
jgi:predicted nucleic acid-binding protein